MSRILTILKKHFTSDPFYFWSFTALAAMNPIVSLFYQLDWLDLAITFALIYISGCLLTTLFCAMGHIGTILKYLSLTIVSLRSAYSFLPRSIQVVYECYHHRDSS